MDAVADSAVVAENRDGSAVVRAATSLSLPLIGFFAIQGAVSIATLGAANCSPANSMPMDDLVQYQPPESLASFHLDTTVNDLVTWGFPDAQRVQIDVATVLTARTPSAVRAASAQLHRDQRVLDTERATIDGVINAASRSLSADVAPPALPS